MANKVAGKRLKFTIMTNYKVLMVNTIDGMLLAAVVAEEEEQATIKAIELNPTSAIYGRIFK